MLTYELVTKYQQLNKEVHAMQMVINERIKTVVLQVASQVPQLFDTTLTVDTAHFVSFNNNGTFTAVWSNFLDSQYDSCGTISLPMELLFSDEALENFIAAEIVG